MGRLNLSFDCTILLVLNGSVMDRQPATRLEGVLFYFNAALHMDSDAVLCCASKRSPCSLTKPRRCCVTVGRVTERGLEAMRELNGRCIAPRSNGYVSCAPMGSKEDHTGMKKASGTKVVKRSRLPAAAVKEMR